jgi:hypothetical protein
MDFKECLEDIERYLWNIWSNICKFKRFIFRLFKWIPILWNQEDWDYDYLYDLIVVKLKEIRSCMEEDTIHVGMEKRVRQIDICLAYLDRYRNWTDYIEYPMDDIKSVKCEDNLFRLIPTNSHNEAKRKLIRHYEEFNYKMFWKRFLQWHRGWWT